MVLVPESVFQAEMTIEGILQASRQIPTRANLAIVGVTMLSMADAFWMATKNNEQRSIDRGQTCPHCGKELEALDLEFCHWCTEPLEPVEEK
jgi:hypothetical protein